MDKETLEKIMSVFGLSKQDLQPLKGNALGTGSQSDKLPIKSK